VVERIRDATVAEAIAAEAGTEATPELVLGDVVNPVLLLQQRPPLAASGYFPGTIGVVAAAVALNTSHVGLFGSGVGLAITRVNWIILMNRETSARDFVLRRVDSPFTGFPSVRAVPGYINAGNVATGNVFSVTKTDTVGAIGVFIATFRVEASQSLFIPGPWILNDGILVVNNASVNFATHVAFGYETWPAVRVQPGG